MTTFFALLTPRKLRYSSGLAAPRKSIGQPVSDIHSGTRWGLAKTYYVASVGVVEPTNFKRAKLKSLAKAMYEGAVMKLLQERLRQLSQRRTIEVLAKPLKDDGLRLVKKNKFTKIQLHLPDREAVWAGTVSLGEIGAELGQT